MNKDQPSLTEKYEALLCDEHKDGAAQEIFAAALAAQNQLIEDHPELADFITAQQQQIISNLEERHRQINIPGLEKNTIKKAQYDICMDGMKFMQALDEEPEVRAAMVEAGLEKATETPATFEVGYRFTVTGGNENLRDINSWSKQGKALPGSNFEVTGLLPDKGPYKYVSVKNIHNGRSFALCVNDQLIQTALTKTDQKDVDSEEIPENTERTSSQPRAGLKVSINTPDKLRTLDGKKAKVQLNPGDSVTFVKPHRTNNAGYQYWEVALPNHDENFSICVNDTLNFTAEQTESQTAEGAGADVLIGGATPDTLTPDETITADLAALDNIGDISHNLEAGSYDPHLIDSNGTIKPEAAKRRIEGIIPWGVKTATITLSPDNRWNGEVPPNQPLAVKREGGTFIFTDPDIAALSKGRVRIEAGDTLNWEATNNISETTEAVTTYDSIVATVQHEKANWEPRLLMPESKMDDAACAAFVQNYLSSTLGMDFMKNSGLIVPGQPTPDAWEMVSVLEASGHSEVVADMSRFFDINAQQKSIRLKEDSPAYQNALKRFTQQAFEADNELGLVTFHYKHTATNAHILESDSSTLNSHVTVNLGAGVRQLEAVTSPGETAADHIINTIKERLGRSYDNSWEANRGHLGLLKNVTVTNAEGETQNLSFDQTAQEFITANGEPYTLKIGDKIAYEDVQLAHFYHNADLKNNAVARIDGLVELLIQGNFEPVGVTQTHGVDDRLNGRVDAEATNQFIVDQIEWDNHEAPTLEGLQRFYHSAYQKAVESGTMSIASGDTLERYAERFAKYCYYHTFKSLLNLAGGGSLPNGAKLPLLDWAHKPGETVSATDPITKDDVVAVDDSWPAKAGRFAKSSTRGVRNLISRWFS